MILAACTRSSSAYTNWAAKEANNSNQVIFLHRWYRSMPQMVSEYSVICVFQLATDPELEVSKGQTLLAAAIRGPLKGNFCPGNTGAPFVGCAPGHFCPTPGEQHRCFAVGHPHSNKQGKPRLNGDNPIAIHPSGVPSLGKGIRLIYI